MNPYDRTFLRQRNVHPSKPVWWERKLVMEDNPSLDLDGNLSLNEERYWTALPHYGKPVPPPPAHVSKGSWNKPVWA